MTASPLILFVDYENVQKLDLAKLPADIRVQIFVGTSQSRVPMELVKQAQAFGDRLQWIQIDGQGHNALDFHLAFYLGKTFALQPAAQCVILSRDTGFDTLVRHLTAQGFSCRRVENQVGIEKAPVIKTVAPKPQAAPVAAKPTARKTKIVAKKQAKVDAAPEAKLKRVIDILKKSPKENRPRRRTSLATVIESYFQKELSEAEITALIDTMFEQELVAETNKVLTYNF